MKRFTQVSIMILLITIWSISIAQVGINSDGTEPDGSAMLDVKSTDKGFLPPRMTHEEMKSISSPSTGLMVFNTTLNKPVFFNGLEWAYFDGRPAVYIGNYFQGGVIFYLDGSGGGLICAVSDHSSVVIWGCHGTEISGADGTAIGTGSQNTIDIEAGCAIPDIAADICANLSLNGYDDWFLPSQDELNEMYQNKAAIDATATANGGNAFTSNLYWSSSEISGASAWYQYLTNGTQNVYGKNHAGAVRAVRAF